MEGDFGRLMQVVGNLLRNAAKFTDPGGKIGLRTEVEEGQALMRISDTGYGIPPERLEALFEMFSQVPEHRRHTGGGGLGIGLALSRRLVELHGGSIDARSEGVGRGSEFAVRLPLVSTTIGASDNGVPEAVRDDQETRSRRVLIADDNVDAAESLRMVLEMKDHVVRSVHDGPSALETMASFAPEIVLLDIGLPQMDGYEVARSIRAMPGGQEVRLFAVTGWGQRADRERAREAGFDRHLTKSLDVSALQGLLETEHDDDMNSNQRTRREG